MTVEQGAEPDVAIDPATPVTSSLCIENYDDG